MTNNESLTTPDKRALRFIRIGRVIKSVRVEMGFQQDYVAAAMGMPRSGLAMLENGRRSLKLEEFFEFCDCVGMKPEKVLERIAP